MKEHQERLMSRWLGIDHGTKRIGVAVGSPEEGIATPVAVIPAEPLAEAVAEIRSLAERYDAGRIVVGWPLNMDDTEGPQGKLARAMAAELSEATGMDVRLWDERLSSFRADEALAGSLTRKKRKARQDAVAAGKILEDFLASGGPQTAPRVRDVTD